MTEWNEKLPTTVDRRLLPAGRIMYRMSEPATCCLLVIRGNLISTVAAPSGQCVALALYGPGDMLGSSALLDRDAVRLTTMTCLTEVEAVVYRHGATADESGNDLIRRCVSELLAETKLLGDIVASSAYCSAEQRIRRAVHRLASHLYRAAGGPSVTLPLTQEQIGSFAQVSRPTTNSVLSTAADRGLLRLRRGAITVVDMGAIASWAR